ncbi:MAG: OmpA family protein [Actinobacteria bacterium]|nr:OmpA family protein [Actinomycetota bacterium]
MLGLLAAAPAVQAQEDVKGGQDHPLVTRMPGFYITSYTVEEFAAFDPTVIGGKDTHWEGKKYTVGYDIKDGATPVSPLQIVRNYEAAARKIGGTLLGGDERRMTAQIRKGGAMTGVYVEAFNDGRSYVVTIVESQEMRQDVVADAAAMGRDLEGSGKTIIYGIHFDTGSAVIKPDSEPALAEMVKLLKNTPALKAFVVGHTDNVGAVDMNVKLSAARAEALVNALVAKGIAASRLRAFGAGPFSPVASNRDERGRAQNRRVELVEQ